MYHREPVRFVFALLHFLSFPFLVDVIITSYVEVKTNKQINKQTNEVCFFDTKDCFFFYSLAFALVMAFRRRRRRRRVEPHETIRHSR